MIEVAYLDSTSSNQQPVKEMRSFQDPTAFAEKLKEASHKTNNRRQTTGKRTEELEKGENRKVWAQERSRADQTNQREKATSDSKESIEDPDQTDQDEAVKSGHSMLMWLLDMPEELNDLSGLSLEKDVVISEDTVKDILLWMQSMTELKNLPEELKELAERLTALLKSQNGLVMPSLTTEEKGDVEAFLAKVESMTKSLMETFSTVITKSNSEHQEVVMQSRVAAEVISENAPADTTRVRETPVKTDVEVIKESTLDDNQITKDMLAHSLDNQSSENQSKEKEFASQVKPEQIITQEQSKEGVIPFSLAQIESMLQQNTMIKEVNQQQTQIQQNVLQQIVDKIQVTHGTNQSFVSLQLAPEHLGKLTIQLTSDLQQGMTAKIYAETPQAKEMIESNFGQLKDALSGKGVNLTALEVFVGQDPESSEKQREFQYQQARAQRRRGSKIASVNAGQTALINELSTVDNPYVQSEGFDQVG